MQAQFVPWRVYAGRNIPIHDWGGEMGIHSTETDLWKISLFFRLERQFCLETSYGIFLHVNSQSRSTRNNVSLYRCCKGFGYKQGSDGSNKENVWMANTGHCLGWTGIRVFLFLQMFRINNTLTWSGCSSHYYERLK